jgi:branched-chain amino acid transport system permease protein
MFMLGYGLQKFMLNRVLGEDILPPLLVTFGLSVVLQNALLEGFSADSQRIPPARFPQPRSKSRGINLGVMPLLTFASAIVVIVGLNQLFYRT